MTVRAEISGTTGPAAVSPAMRVAAAVQLACLIEVSAPKPGNVSPGRHFSDTRFEDFLASAAAIGVPLAGADRRPLGATIRLAIDATAQWTRANTNLGIVLLLAPLARAALACLAGESPAGDQDARDAQPPCVVLAQDLRQALQRVLAETTVQDARDVYAAIRRARPGGLGRADAQDVAGEPTQSLLEVMRLAAGRDGIAREYVSTFAVTFDEGVPVLQRARADGLAWDEAVVETFLTLLARYADTHIERRAGTARAAEVSHQAAAVLDAGGVRTAPGRAALDAMDRSLRDPRNLANPGTTADLTAAAIFVLLVGEEEQRSGVRS